MYKQTGLHITSLFVLSVLLFFLSFSVAPSANGATEKDNLAQEFHNIKPYIRTTADGVRYFDEQAARNDHVDEVTIEVGNNFNLISSAYEKAKHPEYGTVRMSIPVWGNWCGPGYSGPAAPKDYLDTACMHHDICYGEKGYFNCSCDRELINEIWRNMSKMKRKERLMASAVLIFFDKSAC